MSVHQAILTDVRICAGLMREMLFQNKIITLTNSQQQEEQITIVDVIESNTRDRDIERQVVIKFLIQVPRRMDDELFEFKCNFLNFFIKWKSKISCNDNGQYYFLIPKEVIKLNQREYLRTSKTPFASKSYPIQVRTHGLYTQAILEVEDISKQGVGGKLTFYGEFPVSTETQVIGQVDHGNHSYSINAFVKNWSLLTSETSLKNQPTYRVGLHNSIKESAAEVSSNREIWKSENTSETFIERRKQQRYKVNGEITV
jgi:hypothetical protein